MGVETRRMARWLAIVCGILGNLLAVGSGFAQPARLALTIQPGTASCGGPGLGSPPAPPFSGELDSDVAGTTKITNLGLGCLHFGGGNATIIPASRMADGFTSYLDVTGTTLGPSNGTSNLDCTKGPGPARHCLNGNAGTGGGACATDPDCGGATGSCGLDASCYFGPPIDIQVPPPLAALNSCLLNVVQPGAGGTVGTTAGNVTLNLPLASRLYVTGNSASPCPRCVSGLCNTGANAGKACTTPSSTQTSIDCPPVANGFQTPIAMPISPLATAPAVLSDPAGNLCAGQANGGAFGKGAARRIVETGIPAGDLTDGAAHAAVLASAFCIPATGNLAVDGVLDLPGPGALGLPVNARLASGPKVVCVNNSPTVSGPLVVRDLCSASEDTLGTFDALKLLLGAISSEDGGATLRLTAVNLQIVNGASTTDSTNGRGNVVLGYNAGAGNHNRTGSHNLVIGDEHEYGSYGGQVSGHANVILAPGASVTGGTFNTAAGDYASVSGGVANRALGRYASVSGGQVNRALGQAASISGGARNETGRLDAAASISGGQMNRIQANGAAYAASISGGSLNRASGISASVAGGHHNEAIAEASSVTGGASNVAGPPAKRTMEALREPSGAPSVSGGFGNVASGMSASVSGGHGNQATSFAASVSGGLKNRATWTDASVSGGFGNVAGANASSVSGGRDNRSTGPYASVSGGWANEASQQSAAVSGGLSNAAQGPFSSVSGGVENHATGDGSSVSGGGVNYAKYYISSVSGGEWNVASGSAAAVSGGSANVASDTDSTVSGGDHNQATAWAATVSGRCNRTASASCGLLPAPQGFFCQCDFGP